MGEPDSPTIPSASEGRNPRLRLRGFQSLAARETRSSPLVRLGRRRPGGFWLCGPANASGLYRRHIVARPLQYGLASGRGVQGEPHYRAAFELGQVARSSDFGNGYFTAFFPMGMTLLRDLPRSELAQR